MDYQKQLSRWLERAAEDTELIDELNQVKGDPEAVADRFYRDLEFGTGGLRGVIGAGTNRMNIYTVRRATQGLADYLNATDLPKAVAIAHDSRIKGDLFAREAARVLAANGITAHLYPRLEPTPALSWAVRYLGCGAGICVTASHNPAKYNGYEGQAGMETMAKLMDGLRAKAPEQIGEDAVTETVSHDNGGVLEFHTAQGGKVIIRPSGTEPKIKLYLSVKADSEAAAERAMEQLTAGAKALMDPA